ncbi:MAG: bifunctional riboflavin kinase/FAD synthetase [Chitinophagaceae bacterium]|jgi:riboflavin kinase/FMN adenylyltransferase|nr:bifunctional riboflavin kinase/FAD synthetase [Chitinophagaceae bacterium]
MKVHYKLPILPVFKNAVITIGTFDGVHMGHRQVLARLKQESVNANGESVLITFDPHPRKIIQTASQPIRLINTLDEKVELLEEFGIDHLVIIEFTPAFADQTAEEYIRDFLIRQFRPHTIIIGYDHRFGKNRLGDYKLLEKMADVYQYQLKEISAHELNEIKISSTRIREALMQGNLDDANRLLGYIFFFSGEVIDGEKIGRQLGYPTANLKLNDAEKIIPGDGIYAVYAKFENTKYKGMMSIGFRPTMNGTKRVVEINLFDFNHHIYGKMLKVYVKKYLRAEVKFNSTEELVKQMDEDKKASLKIL